MVAKSVDLMSTRIQSRLIGKKLDKQIKESERNLKQLKDEEQLFGSDEKIKSQIIQQKHEQQQLLEANRQHQAKILKQGYGLTYLD